MNLEELTPEEVKSRIACMDEREAKEFFDRLSPETKDKYLNYVMQRTREFLSYLAESPEDRNAPAGI